MEVDFHSSIWEGLPENQCGLHLGLCGTPRQPPRSMVPTSLVASGKSLALSEHNGLG